MPRKARDWSKTKPDNTYIQVWERASQTSPFTLKLYTASDAIRARVKLYETRRILEALNDPLFPLIASLSIYTKENILTIEATDKSIKDALAKSGIGSLEAPDLDDI